MIFRVIPQEITTGIFTDVSTEIPPGFISKIPLRISLPKISLAVPSGIPPEIAPGSSQRFFPNILQVIPPSILQKY